jgi:transposase
LSIEATAEGYAQLVAFAETHAAVRAWALEGTGRHGAGLTRHLQRSNEVVIELDRPVRAKRRHGAKSDPLDAIRAAREALARPRLGTPRASGDRQALAVLLNVRRSAVEGAGDAQRQLLSLLIAAPEPLRAKFRALSSNQAVATAAALRDRSSYDTETAVTAVTVSALRSLARRVKTLQDEAATQEKTIATIVRTWRRDLLDQIGVGPIVAATVLAAWSHTGRIHSESGFAMLAGVAPIPANSGQTTDRHRLNRSGDRQLNRALHTIVLTRIRHGQTTRDYIARRTAEGKTPQGIKRCLKRYIARHLYRTLEHPPLST